MFTSAFSLLFPVQELAVRNIYMNDKVELNYMEKGNYDNLVICCTVPESYFFQSQGRNFMCKILENA